ncbi:hypothetical protein L3Y34_014063 [Caenorhabditis briggsae]|uniref:Chloride channel CLIC-like protein 1 n=1 Tax=Caenorhabditis briggsae TaxID=6238 RepID=A0AAE9DPQ4_CAEBR|nr:hypothetical protein L3Y34_014063 [Caenorhabditis briggsae]
MKTLVLLLLLQIHQITCSKNSSPNKEVNCHDWFPEPITYRLDESHSQLTLDFKIVDDLISDREINESNQIVEDYVIRILNMENGYGGYSDILGIVFKHLPTVRQLIISIFCINTAVIIFSIIWKLGFSEIFEVLGIALRFYEYRSGLTIIPIFCCLGLLILTSNLRSSSGFIMDGIDNLELKNDERFMPIQDRVARKLEMTPCFFDKDFARNIKIWRIEDRYLTKVLNTTILLICRITFTVMVHDQVRKDSFAIFKKANPTKISKNKSINYGELLDVDSTPQSIEGAKLFESNQKFNESVERLAEIMSLEFEKYVEKSCEKSIKTVEEIEKKVEKTGCWRTKGLDGFLEILNATKSTICSFNEEVKLNPIDKSIIRETAYSKWVEALVPLKGLPVIRNSSMEIVRSPMQIYLVFENPSKKLRPTILEHMLDMAVGIGKMAPIYFILSIYFMCILPIMMDQNSEDGGGGSDEKTPKIDSKSKSSSMEKSKSLSNEK